MAASLAGAAIFAGLGPSAADTYLGSYQARMSPRDHHASDGYPLDTAAQIVRQDRANWHRFGRGDAEDEGDRWFRSADSRARLERMLNRGAAMNEATRSAILHGTPVIQVDVYRDSVRVEIVY